jgi:hypothetical protein
MKLAFYRESENFFGVRQLVYPEPRRAALFFPLMVSPEGPEVISQDWWRVSFR